MTAMAGRQIPLPVHLRDEATLENYLPAGDGAALLGALGSLLQPGGADQLFLHGGEGSGKSHLLQACCHRAGSQALYLPLLTLLAYPPEDVLAGGQDMALLCLDDLQAVAGEAQWERAIFNLYNAWRDTGTALVLAASAAPRNLEIALPDLSSRLSWGAVYHLSAPDDERRREILQFRARKRGLDLSEEVSAFLVNRAPRSMDSLLGLLDRLDQASLAQQRGLSIPFVKQILDL